MKLEAANINSLECLGITNGISCFQKIMDEIISEHALSDTFSYLDDITICGKNQRGA